MQLKYVGPKPIISHTGIEFDNNKEDKFAYLNIVMQFLNALNHDYIPDKVYKYHAETNRLSNEDLLRQLKTYCPSVEKLIDETQVSTSQELDHELERITESQTLSPEEKDAYLRNLKLMYDYRTQRAVNKSVYYCAINAMATLLKQDQIDYIVAPMFQTFAHVLHSAQGVLRKQEFLMDTKLDIYEEDGKLLIKLQVINL